MHQIFFKLDTMVEHSLYINIIMVLLFNICRLQEILCKNAILIVSYLISHLC
ncbi:unknown [Salmonella phage FelixO1]|uniref:Uncharacterized protein n=1 Tax=Salmonella phage Felix O1 (isolate Felix O1-VT1) TaxID=1283336 RepID=Q6KGD9_BPFO1|nr:unknown [Salmonella phage FelixO1]